MGESTDGMITNTSKLRDQVKELTNINGSGGVDILTASGEYRDTYDILVDIAEVYDDIIATDNKKAAGLTELLAGKHRANVLSSILQNPEDLKNAYEMALDSDGSAMAENEKYLDSIQGKMDQFTNQLQVMWMNTFDSSLVKGVIDLGTGLLKVVDTIGLFPSLLGAVSIGFLAIKKINPVTLFKDLQVQMYNYGLAMERINAIQSMNTGPGAMDANTFNAANINAYAAAVSGLTGKQQAQLLAAQGLNQEQIKSALITNQVSEATIQEAIAETTALTAKREVIAATAGEVAAIMEKNGITLSSTALNYLNAHSTEEVGEAMLQAAVEAGAMSAEEKALIMATLGMTGANSAASLSFRALGESIKAAFMSNPIGMAIMAITTAISIAIPLIDKFVKSNDELIEQADEVRNSYQQETNTINENISTLKGLESEFMTLSKGVDDYGANISLATSDYERYQEIVQQILNISPGLVAGYDAEGNAIANKNKLLERAIELEQMKQKEEAKEFVNEDSRKTIFDGYQANLDKYESDLEKTEYDARSSLIEFKNEFKKAADKHGIKKLIKSLDIDGVDPDTYDTAGGARLFAEKYYKEIAEALRTEKGNFNKYFSEGATLDMLDDAYRYDTYKQQLEDGGKSLYSSELTTWLQEVPRSLSAYYELDEEAKNFLSGYISSLDVASIKTESDLKSMQTDVENFTKSLANSKQFRSDALEAFNIASGDGLNVKEYKKQIEDFKQKIDKSGYTEDQENSIFNVLGWNTDTKEFENNVTDAIDHTQALLKNSNSKAAKEFIDNLSVEDALLIQTHISAEPGTMSIEELESKVQNIRESQGININTHNTYSALSSSVESYNELLAQSTEVVANNVEVTQEYKDSLIALAGSEEKVNECFYEGNPLVVKNAAALQELVESSRQNINANIELAKSQSRFQYYELVQELNGVCNELANTSQKTGELTDESFATAESLIKQIDAVQQAIYKYQLLETQLNAAGGAFEKFNQAQEVDALNTTGDSYVSMAQTIYDAFYKTGQVGTQAFDSAVQALVPDSVYASLESDGAKLKAIYSYFNKNVLPSLTLDGESLSIAQKDIEDFVDKGLSKGLFKGSKDNGLKIVDEMNLEKGAKLMGMTEASLTAMLAELDKYDYNTSAESFLSQIDDSFDSQIMSATSKIQKLNEEKLALLEDGGYEKNKKRINEINNELGKTNKKMQNLQSTAVESFAKYEGGQRILESLETVEDKTQTVQGLLDKGFITKEQAIEFGIEGDDTVQEVMDKIKAKQLELGEPTELMIQFAQEGVTDEIDTLLGKLQKDGIEIPIKYNSKTGDYDFKKNKYIRQDTETGEYKIKKDSGQQNNQALQQLVQKMNLFDSLKNFADNGMVTTETYLSNISNSLNAICKEVTGKDAPDQKKIEKKEKKPKDLSNYKDKSTLESQLKAEKAKLKKIKKEAKEAGDDKGVNAMLAKKDDYKAQEKKVERIETQISYNDKLSQVKGLGEKKQNAIAEVAVDYTDGAATLKDLQSQLDTIKNEKVKASVTMELANEGTFDKLLSNLDKGDKKIVVKALTEGTGDVDELNKTIDGIKDEDVQTEVRALVDDAMTNLEVVDGKLQEVDGTAVEPKIKVDTDTVIKGLEKIENLTDDDKQIVIDAVTNYNNGGGINDLIDDLDKLKNKDIKTQVIATLAKEGSFDEFLSSLTDENRQIVIDALVSGEGDVEQLRNIIDELPDNVRPSIQALVDYILGSQEPPKKGKTKVDYNKGKQAPPTKGKTKVDYKKGKQDAPKKGEAKVNYKRGSQEQPKSLTAWVKYKLFGGGGLNGNAHAKGNAFAGGTALKGGKWGAKKTETALTGELGQELVNKTAR